MDTDVIKFVSSTPLDPISFKVLNEPLEKVIDKVIGTLTEKARREYTDFDFYTSKILSGCHQTYKAIRKLIAKDPKFPAQVHILNRTLFDSLFIFEAFAEDTEKYPRDYALAGYRMMWEQFNRENEAHSADPDWTEYLSLKEKLLEFTADNNNLTEQEREEPTSYIPFWPIPSRMLKGKIFSGEKKDFLKELYENHYSWDSAISHFQWAGMAAMDYSNKLNQQLIPDKFESDAIANSMLYLLMILSVIESTSKIGVIQDLKYIWTILGSYWKEADYYYNFRFKNLLD